MADLIQIKFAENMYERSESGLVQRRDRARARDIAFSRHCHVDRIG